MISNLSASSGGKPSLCIANLPSSTAKYGFVHIHLQTHFHWHCHHKSTENYFMHIRAEVCTGKSISYVERNIKAMRTEKQ